MHKILERPANSNVFKRHRVRPGTDRHRVLRLLDGSRTPTEIGRRLGFARPGYALSHLYCLARDVGVGYQLDEEGRATALYPEGESLDTAVAKPKRRSRSKPAA